MKEIPLTQGKVALVDDEDFDRLVAMGKWSYSDGGYAVRMAKDFNNKGVKTTMCIRMHRVVLGVKDSKVYVDHINRCGVDNRRSNLRLATNSQNQLNTVVSTRSTTGYKGVTFVKRIKRYRASITKNGKFVNLGHYLKIEDAAYAYNLTAKKLFGEFATLNELPSDYEFKPIKNEKKNVSKSGYRYIYLHKDKYSVSFLKDGKMKFIGLFETLEMAISARDKQLIEWYGDLRKPNNMPANGFERNFL